MKTLLLRTDELGFGEADMLCGPAIRDWLTERGFTLTTCDQLAGTGSKHDERI